MDGYQLTFHMPDLYGNVILETLANIVAFLFCFPYVPFLRISRVLGVLEQRGGTFNKVDKF